MAVKFLSEEWLEQMQEKLKQEFSKKGRVNSTFAQIVENIPDGSEDTFIMAELKDSLYVNYTIGPIDDLPEDALFKVFGDYEYIRALSKGI